MDNIGRAGLKLAFAAGVAGVYVSVLERNYLAMGTFVALVLIVALLLTNDDA